ncbi:MAG: hypothetical protein HUJ71_09320, partial [Pseudobutyrivibrio sp.]|nr:hypothetical protein [Pseudobutyrivibrio sp.]
NNGLINAIKFSHNEEQGTNSLEIALTGLDQARKDRLSSEWYELYKYNKELAMDLFYYNFFKGGIGFNPKTFMSILPIEMRMQIPGYREVFEDTQFKQADAEIMMKQFLAHNTSNSRLFPTKELRKTSGITNGYLLITKEEMGGFLSRGSFKFKDEKGMWHFMVRKEVYEDGLLYEELTPLGDNGNYFEISLYNQAGLSNRSINRKHQRTLKESTKEVKDNDIELEDSTGEMPLTEGQESAMAERIIQGMADTKYGGVSNITQQRKTFNYIVGNAESMLKTPSVEDSLRKAMESAGIKFERESVLDKLKELNLC